MDEVPPLEWQRGEVQPGAELGTYLNSRRVRVPRGGFPTLRPRGQATCQEGR